MTIPQDTGIITYELIVSNNCNFKCSYCYNKEHSSKVDCKNMSVDMIPDIIQFMKMTRNTKKMEIIFIGGEPTINMSFVKAITKELEKEFSPSIQFLLSTNLSIITKEDMKYCVDHKFIMDVSIDGKQETHNKNRQDWATVVSNIVTLQSMYIDAYGPSEKFIDICYVVNGDVEKIIDNSRFLKSMSGKDGPKVNIQINFKRSWSQDEISEMVKQIRIAFPERIMKLPVKCGHTPKNSVAIDADGKIYLCSPFMREETSLGNIRDGYINEIVYDNMLSACINKFPGCESCLDADNCKPCIAAHWETNASFTGTNKNYCDIKHGLLRRKNE